MIAEDVFNSRDNIAEWVLFSDDAVMESLSAVTNMKLLVDDVEYDAVTLGSALFNWTGQKDYAGTLVDVVSMKLGKFGFAAGIYNKCRLRVYDENNTDGISWEDDITLTVIDTEATA